MGITVTPTKLQGVVVIEPQVIRDSRGFFFESYRKEHLEAAGIHLDFIQDNHSRSTKGVLRGLHYQDMSAPMAKLVRCSFGSLLDVAVDLRIGSPTLGQWVGVELSADNARQLLVPAGFGHGFVVLSDVAELQYKCTNVYTPQAEGAIAWNDPDLGIDWGLTGDPIMSNRDKAAMSYAQYLQKPAFHL